MPQRKTIVRKCETLPKPRLHDLLMIGWQRMVSDYGKQAFAEHLGISTVALDKQLTGSMPGFEHILNAVCADPHVLDEVLAAMGKRMVEPEAECDVDDLSVILAKLMLWKAQAEHPESPGGKRIVRAEIADGEKMLRQVHKISGDLLASLTVDRLPRAVA